MEVLVVVVLTGMVSTLLIQGLSYVLNLRIRFLTRAEEQTVTILQTHWLTKVTAGLMPSPTWDGAPFKGEAARFTGLSLAPLMGMQGVPTPVTLEWRFENGNIILQYSEGKSKPWEIGRWERDSGTEEAAGFIYLAEDGSSYKEWPPPKGMFPQLPRAIILEVRAVRGPMAWLVAMSGCHDPIPSAMDAAPRI